MATDPNRPGHGGAASSPLISSLSGVDGEGAPYAPPPSPIIAAPASSSTVSAATSAPSTGAYLGETSGITGHRLGQEYASVPSSSGIAFVSFGLLPREVLSTDLRLDLGSVFAASHMTNSSSAGQHMAFGYANSSDLSSPSHDLMQAQQQQSGRRPEAPRAGCPTRSRISGGSSSGSQLEGKLPTIGPQGKVIAIESYASSIWRMMQVEWASSAEMNRRVNFWQIRPVLGESSSQATVKLQDDSQAPHKNSVNALQLPDGTNQLQHKTSASSSSIEEPPSFRLFGQTMTPGVPPRRDSRGPSLQPIANDEDEQVPTMRKRLEALLPDNI